MLDFLRIVISNVLVALYQPFWFSVILSVLFMTVYQTYRSAGAKAVMRQWWGWFRQDVSFRRRFFLVFYTTMILFRTLLNRYIWINPVSDVVGVWGFYNAKGEFTTEALENLVMFIPFTFLLLWTWQAKSERDIKFRSLLWRGVKTAFYLSAIIEFLQLFLRLGTWQLSDLFYNTLGGLIGGCIYCVCRGFGFEVKGKTLSGDGLVSASPKNEFAPNTEKGDDER